MLSKTMALAGALGALAAVLVLPASGERLDTTATNGVVLSATTVDLDNRFTSPWQIAWIPSGTETGALAFTDRGGNQVGIHDPASQRTQTVRLNHITNPGPIAVLDDTRFAIAGTSGVAIFDRAGTGRVTELVMANTRNQALAVVSGGNLLVADAQQHDLRIIRPPYSGPADITRFPIPQQCLNPTGLIPGTATITILCQQTNNIVNISYTGTFGGSTPLPIANAGAQEARPSPNGFVFSVFNANRFFAFSPSFSGGFKSFALTGPAVPTVGLFYDPASDRKLAQAAARIRAGKQPARAFYFNSFTPSFRGGSFALGSFPGGTARTFDRLANRNLVGSTNGPGGSIWVTDATPGRPALHRITVGDGVRTGRTRTGYQFSQTFTRTDPGFLARMTMPFIGPTPSEVRVNVTGASASPWNLKPTFADNFGLRATVRAALPGAGSYQVKVSSADTGPYQRVYTFSLRPRTRSATLTSRGESQIPASFKVDAVAEVKPCECDSLDVTLSGTGGPDGRKFVGLEWQLRCTGGAGDCQGTLSIAGDRATRVRGVRMAYTEVPRGVDSEPTPFDIRVKCEGDCAQNRKTRNNDFRTRGGGYLTLAPPFGKNFGSDVRSVTVVVERTCRRVLAPKIFEIVFGRDGKVDRRRSDLNGNGIADGKEKRR